MNHSTIKPTTYLYLFSIPKKEEYNKAIQINEATKNSYLPYLSVVHDNDKLHCEYIEISTSKSHLELPKSNS